jgi:hypothetical protein
MKSHPLTASTPHVRPGDLKGYPRPCEHGVPVICGVLVSRKSTLAAATLRPRKRLPQQAGPDWYRDDLQVPRLRRPSLPTVRQGRRPEYCTDPAHTAVNAWREHRRLDAVARGESGNSAATLASETPVTMARVAGAELLRQVKAEGDKLTACCARPPPSPTQPQSPLRSST